MSRSYDVLQLAKSGPFWGDMSLFYSFRSRQLCQAARRSASSYRRNPGEFLNRVGNVLEITAEVK